MAVKRDLLYVHPTWLAKLMAGEASCEWATWYRAHYKDWTRPPSDFDEAKYTLEHTSLAREMRSQRDAKSERLFFERQSSFWFTHLSGIRMSCTPNLISLNSRQDCIYDARPGQPRAFHKLQLLIFMYTAARSEHMAFFDRRFAGVLQYPDQTIEVEPEEASGAFEEQFNFWLNLLASKNPLERFPSESECRFCNIGKPDCPERMAEATVEER